jgi:MFS family permease
MLALITLVVFLFAFQGVALVLGGWTDLDRITAVVAMIVAVLPAGLLLDRIGVRRTGYAAGALWFLGALGMKAGGDATIVAASIAVGAATAVAAPLAAKATASWFPRSERGRATAIWIAAANFPIVLVLSPLTAGIAAHRNPLFAAAAALIAMVAISLYRDVDDPRTTYAERAYIENGGAQPVAIPSLAPSLGAIVRSRNVWALAFAFGAFSYAFGIGVVQIWSITPNVLALVVNVLIGGVVVDALARGDANAHVRRDVLVAGTLCGCATLGILGHGASATTSFTAIALLGFASAQPVVWSLPGFIAPRGATGTLTAILALAGTLGAFIVWWTAEDSTGATIAAVLGAAAFAFALGRIEPMADPV